MIRKSRMLLVQSEVGVYREVVSRLAKSVAALSGASLRLLQVLSEEGGSDFAEVADGVFQRVDALRSDLALMAESYHTTMSTFFRDEEVLALLNQADGFVLRLISLEEKLTRLLVS